MNASMKYLGWTSQFFKEYRVPLFRLAIPMSKSSRAVIGLGRCHFEYVGTFTVGAVIKVQHLPQQEPEGMDPREGISLKKLNSPGSQGPFPGLAVSFHNSVISFLFAAFIFTSLWSFSLFHSMLSTSADYCARSKLLGLLRYVQPGKLCTESERGKKAEYMHDLP